MDSVRKLMWQLREWLVDCLKQDNSDNLLADKIDDKDYDYEINVA